MTPSTQFRNRKYYQLSTDYDLADKILKEGGSIIQQAKSDFSGFFVITNSAGLGDNFDYLKESNTQFLLPIPDPTYELKTDLAEVQQQCSKLRAELTLQKEHASAFTDSAILSLRDIRTLEDFNTQKEQAIEALQHSLTQALNEADELREKINTVDECEDQNTYKALQYSKDRIDELININANLEREIKILQETLERSNSLHETQIHRRNIASQAQIESINALREQRDNLNRSQSDRLSELTNIMRMVQALEDTPQDKIDGAIYLIKRVLYDSICKLDPSQSWDA